MRLSSAEDLDIAPDMSSSSFGLVTQPNPPATFYASIKSVSQLVFKYDIDEPVLTAIESGRLHEWIAVGFKAICKEDDLAM